MAAFRKLALTVVLLAAFGCVATAGALSQPNRLRFSADAPLLHLSVGRLRTARDGAYAGTLVVSNRGRAPARLYLSLRGGGTVALRDRRNGRLLFRGRIRRDASVGLIAPGATRTISIVLRPATGRRVSFRVSGAAL